jgi:protocatechuate 3,4-dioxygenase beta subunit
MTMRIALLLAAAAVAYGQAPRFASVAGIVLDDATRAPLLRVVVTLETKGEKPANAVAWTDSSGAFSFSSVPPGDYYLYATRDGYEFARYGAASRDRPPEVLTLAPGEARLKIVFRMRRLASVSGTVLDPDGDPLSGVNVNVLAATYMRRKLHYAPVSGAMTDDRGQYRVAGLLPGKYYVAATPQGWQSGTGQAEAVRGQAAETPKFGAQFYANADRISAATPIELQPGKNLADIDFQLALWHTASIKAKVIVPSEIASDAQVQVTVWSQDAARETNFSWGGGAAAPDYTFEVKDLIPGSYAAVAVATSHDRRYRGVERVEVGQDPEEVTIQLEPGIELSGRVRLEGGKSAPPHFRVSLVPGDGLPFNMPQPEAEVKADGTFRIEGVLPGVWDIGVEPIPKDGFVKSMRLGDQDVLTEDMLIGPATSEPLNIVLSTRGAIVDGTVTEDGEDGKPAKAFVLLAPDGKFENVWTLYRMAPADQSGHFEMKGIMPGSYKLYALDRIDTDPSQNPEFLKPFLDLGEPVILNEGGHETKRLRLISGVRQ